MYGKLVKKFTKSKGYQLQQMSGISLVSLIIGLALSTFIIGVMLQVFSTARANQKLSENFSEMQDVMRYASVILQRVIGQAGYRTPPAGSGSYADYDAVFIEPGGDYPGEVIRKWSYGVDTSFWVKFQGHDDGHIKDCEGVTVTASETSTLAAKSKFHITDSDWGVNDGVASSALVCYRDNMDNSDVSDSIKSIIVPPAYFEGFWLRLGEDTDGDGAVNRYIKSDQSGIDYKNIYAVKIALLIHSRDDVRQQNYAETFNIFDETYAVDDKKIYKLQFFTIPLPFANYNS